MPETISFENCFLFLSPKKTVSLRWQDQASSAPFSSFGAFRVMAKYYAGIGSRATPPYVLEMMTDLAKTYREEGYILRSGGARGADSAFEKGAGDQKEIFLPWKRFMEHPSPFFTPTKEAWRLAPKFHPAWDRLTRPAKLLHARNVHQILGRDLKTPVEFVSCWTPGGALIGGTATAIRIANAYDIRVINLGVTNP